MSYILIKRICNVQFLGLKFHLHGVNFDFWSKFENFEILSRNKLKIHFRGNLVIIYVVSNPILADNIIKVRTATLIIYKNKYVFQNRSNMRYFKGRLIYISCFPKCDFWIWNQINNTYLYCDRIKCSFTTI